MTFQSPRFLWLLLLLLVPLILYLLPMPRRQVASSALFLWERFLSQERFGRTSERLRRALGFALIFVIIACLILAVAEPTLGRAPIAARRLIVLIDTSASMNAVRGGMSNLERAKAAAARLIESLDAQTHVAIVEAAGDLNVVAPFEPAGRDLARRVWQVEPFEGPTHLRRLLDQAHILWGAREDVALYVFTDGELPESRWGPRACAWLAPPAGNNVAIIEFDARRRGREILLHFALANYGAKQRRLVGLILIGGRLAGRFGDVELGGGKIAERSFRCEDPDAGTVEVRLDGNADALACDDVARALVPTLDDLRVRVAWPGEGKRNTYVAAVLSALRDEGLIALGTTGDPQAIVYVNHLPRDWPARAAIALYPLNSGAVEIEGLHAESATVTRQAPHPLLDGVDLRGLSVKRAVRSRVPAWAEPLVWADDLPLVWAGQLGKRKAAFVGIPLSPSGSRLPLVASFPVLMRNALLWMLPPTRALRPGERVDGWTPRRTGFLENPKDGQAYGSSLLSAPESDLRRKHVVEGEAIPGRRSLAFALLTLAIVLLPVEWALFHKRLTE